MTQWALFKAINFISLIVVSVLLTAVDGYAVSAKPFQCQQFYGNFQDVAKNIKWRAENDYQKLYGLVSDFMAPSLPHGQLLGRVKSKQSILAKLRRRAAHLTNPILAKYAIEDSVGMRLVLNDSSPKQIDQVINNLVQARQRGDIKVLGVRDHTSSKVPGYLNDDQMGMLTDMIARDVSSLLYSRLKLYYSWGVHAVEKKNGFIGFNLFLQNREGVYFELQIIGDKVEKIANEEHTYYDWYSGKHIDNKQESIYRAAGFITKQEHGLNALAQDQLTYVRYLNQKYEEARKQELEEDYTPVQFPFDLLKYPDLELGKIY